MPLEKNTLEFYYFSDIQKFICDELKIKEEYFRDYHKVVGGKYKDFWYVWCTLVRDRVPMNCCIQVNFEFELLDMDFAIEEYGEWIKCLIPVFEKLEKEIGEDFYVYYDI